MGARCLLSTHLYGVRIRPRRCRPREEAAEITGPAMLGDGTSGWGGRPAMLGHFRLAAAVKTRDYGARAGCLSCDLRRRRAAGHGRPPAPRVVPGEASESDSEPEVLGGPWGSPGAGLKVPGEASETEEEEEEEEEGAQRPKTPPVVAEEPAAVWGYSRGGPSLLQQRLREGTGRLQGAVGNALRQSYGNAARHLGGLGGALGRAQATAAAAAHCLRLARRDLRAVAATVDIVTACRLLPDIRGQLPAL
ncbi:biogenesis of lysosome-related organelles complex 1 subunit 3 [Falco cherrug]|uniref:biogenesis of lysosome-related organelles complex 1 subunit 3 n=1 Tax=Falco cherrug TaxID=345164 RepID=UPI00247A8330|nr:biogenesis of lysosome-related organelles complex 1 subunit 3 [Falco cherrug]